MDAPARIDRALRATLSRSTGQEAPPKLAAALEHVLFPGGARVRPLLTLAVAMACGDDSPALSDAAAASLELMHCASLVHDDLPCFDDAGVRRGKATLHVVYGEPVALLAGDALIVLAFETLARAGAAQPQRLVALIRALAQATGMPSGICAGQAWESEAAVPLDAYHRAKTGALFVAATTMGAMSAGADPGPWRALGERLGEAYQVADDLRDLLLTPEELGKPAGQDAAHGRPNAATALGVAGAKARLDGLIAEASAAIPACRGDAALREIVRTQARRLTPRQLAAAVA